MTAVAVPHPSPSPSAPPAELDRLTLERARRGDRAALHAFVTRYERPVFALLARLVGRHAPTLVEDLAQDTFLKALGALPRFDPSGPAKLSTWLLTIASRTAIDALRARRVSVVSIDDDEAGHDPPDERAPVPLDVIAKKRRTTAVADAVAALPDAQRLVLVLFTWHGFSLREIAAALDVEEGTVKSRLSRARATLAHALAEVSHDA